jgi:hypothetical protein
MVWNKTIQSQDVLCFEKRTKHYTIKIECRKQDSVWNIYRTYILSDEVSFSEEYTAEEQKLAHVLAVLQTQKHPTIEELKKRMLSKSQKLTLRVERSYKEYDVEKWKFGIGSDPLVNTIHIRRDEEIHADVILAHQYKGMEDALMNELFTILGLMDIDGCKVQFYYYTTSAVKQYTQEGVDMFLG